jgi:hypothetical protein
VSVHKEPVLALNVGLVKKNYYDVATELNNKEFKELTIISSKKNICDLLIVCR